MIIIHYNLLFLLNDLLLIEILVCTAITTSLEATITTIDATHARDDDGCVQRRWTKSWTTGGNDVSNIHCEGGAELGSMSVILSLMSI